MARIFLSYRRSDSQAIADRMYDRLVKEFSSENVFKDVDSVPLGADFRRVIQDSVAKADAFLAVIGPDWLNAVDASGSRRLDDPDDFVRIEIETALTNSITVIPITVANAAMPRASDLPEILNKLAFHQGLDVRPDPDFHRDMTRLVRSIQEMFGSPSSRTQQPEEESLSPHFVEVLKHRALLVLDYINSQRRAALFDARPDCRHGKKREEIERRYQSALESFPKLHEQYLDALRSKNMQLAHEILGEIYQLVHRCQHTRYEEPPRFFR